MAAQKLMSMLSSVTRTKDWVWFEEKERVAYDTRVAASD